MSAGARSGDLLELRNRGAARPDHRLATSSACTDEALLARTSGGDAPALGLLYERHAGRAFRVAWSICRDPGRAEDAVQDAFLSIWRSAGTYQAERSVPTSWLMTVVRSRAIDAVRHDVARHARNVAVDELERTASSDDVWAEVARRFDAHDLRGLISDLPAEQREAITLAYYGGLTQLQIASHLELPYGTVKSRIRLGLEKLRDAAFAGIGEPGCGRTTIRGHSRSAVMEDFAHPAGTD